MNGEIAMDEMRKNRERELILWGGRAVGPPKRKDRVAFWIKLIVICCLAFCLALALAFAVSGHGGENGLWEKLCGFAFGNGFIFGDEGFDKSEQTSPKEEDQTEGITTEAEIESDETEEQEERTETEAENESSSVIASDFSEAEKGDGYLLNYSDRKFDIEGLLEMGFHAEYYPESPAPMVLILHTHTSEGYSDFDSDDPTSVLTASVVAIGEALTTELNRAKIPTVHCSVIHDDDGDAYQNAAETIEMMLKIYPTVEYVIDLHRMELTDAQGNLVRTCSAKQTAQLRMTVSTAGVLTKGTLSLAMCLREELNGGGARVCMPVVLTDSEYNAAGSMYYLKLDVGSLGNSSDEARAAVALFAEAFAEIIVG